MTNTLRGNPTRSLWQSNEADADGLIWGVFLFTDQIGNTFKAAGKLAPDVISSENTLELFGAWGVDKRGQKQYQFKNYSRVQPAGRWGIIAFLSKAAGIGPTIAEAIYNAFEEDSINAILERKDEVLAKVPALRPEVANEAAIYLSTIVDEMRLKLPLLDLFKGTKVGQRIADKVIEARIPDAVDSIKRNPFLLMEFRGVAFKSADSLRVKLRLPSNMPERILGACHQAFYDASDKTWISISEISKVMKDLLEMSSFDAIVNVNKLVEQDKVVKNQVGDGVWYALKQQALNEEYVAQEICERRHIEGCWPVEEIMAALDGTDEIDEHQREVLRHNLTMGGRIAVLPGSPGTGKTYVLGKIIRACVQMGMSVAAAAPTGKAAQRLNERLGNITTATTIHRLLKPKPVSGGGFVFSENSHDITHDIIAIDESSMVSNELAAALFRGLSYNCRILFVGDRNQLPPVGCGTLMRDLQECGYREFEKIVRNAGMIVEACHAIKSGERPQLHLTGTPGQNVETSTNVHLVSARKNEDKATKILKIVEAIKAGKFVDKNGTQLGPNDIQFLTATHAEPNIGRHALNKFLQSQLNPGGKGEHEIFKVGDKVLNNDNTFLEGFVKDDQGNLTKPMTKIFVSNGDMGTVIVSEKKRIQVLLASGNARVVVPCGESNGSWDLGFCCTTHKAQGSEWLYVVAVIGDDYGSKCVASREFLYTALSRAKHCTILVSSVQGIGDLVKESRMWDRKSLILELMESYNAQTI